MQTALSRFWTLFLEPISYKYTHNTSMLYVYGHEYDLWLCTLLTDLRYIYTGLILRSVISYLLISLQYFLDFISFLLWSIRVVVSSKSPFLFIS